MTYAEPLATVTDSDIRAAGRTMMELIRAIFPLCRSITGPGVRETLSHVAEMIPLQITELPTGARVFDWTVPREWAIEEAYLEHEDGRRFVDFRSSNLHVVSYSAPVDVWLPLAEMRKHLHTLPPHPDWVPYRTSYYADTWGFCLSERASQSLPEGNYHAVIRSRLYDGSLTFAEYVHEGRTSDEVLVFTHTCHPSLCNDNLTGIAVAATLAKFIRNCDTRYTYRFVFAPATIGSIAWLSKNEARLGDICHGLVLAMLGDTAALYYHPTESGDATIDRAATHVLRKHYPDAQILEFSPWGFDERQFNSPGFRLPVGRLTRSPSGKYVEEHSSADSLEAISPEAVGEAWRACLRIFEVLEGDVRYRNLAPHGEPQLGRRGLYRRTGGHYDNIADRSLAFLWLLNQSDGRKSLLDIAERSGLDFALLAQCARELERAELLAPCVAAGGKESPLGDLA